MAGMWMSVSTTSKCVRSKRAERLFCRRRRWSARIRAWQAVPRSRFGSADCLPATRVVRPCNAGCVARKARSRRRPMRSMRLFAVPPATCGRRGNRLALDGQLDALVRTCRCAELPSLRVRLPRALRSLRTGSRLPRRQLTGCNARKRGDDAVEIVRAGDNQRHCGGSLAATSRAAASAGTDVRAPAKVLRAMRSSRFGDLANPETARAAVHAFSDGRRLRQVFRQARQPAESIH